MFQQKVIAEEKDREHRQLVRTMVPGTADREECLQFLTVMCQHRDMGILARRLISGQAVEMLLTDIGAAARWVRCRRDVGDGGEAINPLRIGRLRLARLIVRTPSNEHEACSI